MNSSTKKGPGLAGVIGYFENTQNLIEAMEKVRDAKWASFDAFSPFPVHGMDEAQGLKRSPIPYVTFAAGLTGFCLAFLLQYWTSVVDWPLIVGGKPFNSWPAFVPIMFELTVLFAGLCTVGAMFLFNRLPNITRKAFDPKLTRDRFAIVIDAPILDDEGEPKVAPKKGTREFDESAAADFLKKVGATDVRTVYHEGWF